MVRIFFLSCLLLLVPVSGLVAQQYPSKPVRMVIPWPPAGANDILGRALGESLARTIGQQVIIDNRGGANGLIGADIVAKSPPDGYTIMFHSITSHVTNPVLFKTLTYDTLNDFAPITQIASIPLVVVVHPSFPAKNVSELVALAKVRPGQINYASFGTASISHLAGELFNAMAGVKLVHVPYKGAGPAMIETLGGQVPIYFASVAPSLPHIQAGKLRALAVTGEKRSKQRPEIPAIAETPPFKGYEAVGMFAVWAPARTPADTLSKIHQAIVKALAAPEFRQRLDEMGASDPIGNRPEEMAKTIRSDMEKLTKLAKAAGVQPQ